MCIYISAITAVIICIDRQVTAFAYLCLYPEIHSQCYVYIYMYIHIYCICMYLYIYTYVHMSTNLFSLYDCIYRDTFTIHIHSDM